MESLVLSSTHGFTQCWRALPSTVQFSMQAFPACTSQSSHAYCQQLTWKPRKDLSHKQLCGCSSGREEIWQHQLPFAMSIQTKVLSRCLLTPTISTHQPGTLFATAGPTSCFLPLIRPRGSPSPVCCPVCSSQKDHLAGSHLLGSTVAPSPFAENWDCISGGGEIILLPLVWIWGFLHHHRHCSLSLSFS